MGPGDSELCKKYFLISREGRAITLLNVFHCGKIQQGSFLLRCLYAFGNTQMGHGGALNCGMSHPAMLPCPGTATLCTAWKSHALTDLDAIVSMRVFPETNSFTPKQSMEQFLGWWILGGTVELFWDCAIFDFLFNNPLTQFQEV